MLVLRYCEGLLCCFTGICFPTLQRRPTPGLILWKRFQVSKQGRIPDFRASNRFFQEIPQSSSSVSFRWFEWWVNPHASYGSKERCRHPVHQEQSKHLVPSRLMDNPIGEVLNLGRGFQWTPLPEVLMMETYGRPVVLRNRWTTGRICRTWNHCRVRNCNFILDSEHH